MAGEPQSAPKKRGRPRGPNFEKNQKRSLQALVNSGAIAPEVVESEEKSDPGPPQTVGEVRGEIMNFLKSVAGVWKRQGPIWRGSAPVGDKRVQLYDDKTQELAADGVILRPAWRIPYDHLRDVQKSVSLIGSCHQLYVDNARPHGFHSADHGFDIFQKDVKGQVARGDDAEKLRLAEWIEAMGNPDSPEADERDTHDDVLEMATRDTLDIDEVCYLRTWAAKKDIVVDVRYLDPATIMRVDSERGYRGDRHITHAQVIDGQVREVFEEGRIVKRSRTKFSDIRYRGWGWSVIEGCIMDALGMLQALRSNLEKFNGQNPPRKILTSEFPLTAEVQELLDDIWHSNYGPGASVHRFPMLHGVKGVDAIDLHDDSDIIFEHLIMHIGTNMLARHSVDPAELGVRFTRSAAMSEARMDERAKFSQNRRMEGMMTFHRKCMGQVFRPNLSASRKQKRFLYTGITMDDADARQKRDIAAVGATHTLDEVRNRNDEPPWADVIDEYIKAGTLSEEQGDQLRPLGLSIMNPVFMGVAGQMLGAAKPQAGSEGTADEASADQEPADEDPQYEFDLIGDDESPDE